MYKSCKLLLRKLSHLHIDSYGTDEWKSYQKHIPQEKHVIAKRKTTHIERRNRDFGTHLERLCRKTACFSTKDDMHYGIIETYIQHRNAA